MTAGPGRTPRLSTERKVQWGFGVALFCLAMIGALAWSSVLWPAEGAMWKWIIAASATLSFAAIATVSVLVVRGLAGSRNVTVALRGAHDLLAQRERERSAEFDQTYERAIYLASFPEKNPHPIFEVDTLSGSVRYANLAARGAFPELAGGSLRAELLANLRAGAQTDGAKLPEVVQHEVDVGRQTFAFTITQIRGGHLRVYGSDVTARREAERLAERQRAELELIFDSVPALMFYKDAESRLLRVNGELARLIGLPKEQIEGRTDAETGSPYAEQHRADDLEVLKTGRPVRKHVEQIFTARGDRWVETDKIPHRNEKGEIIGIIGFAVDTTEQRRVNQERDQLVRLIEHSSDFIAMADLDGRLTFMNSGARRMIGFAPEANPGELRFVDYVPENWRGFFRDTVVRTALEQGVWEGEMQLRHLQTGALVDVFRSTFLLLDAAGQPSAFATVTRDITESKRAALALHESERRMHEIDRRLAEIVHGMTEACFALDAEWRFTFLNDRGETLLHRRREEMLGRTIWTVFPQLVGTPMEQNYRRAMAERVPVAFEVFSPVAERWLDIRLFPTGEGLAAFLLDIQARKQAEETLRASEDQFRTMANSIPQLAWMAHADGFIFWYNRRWHDYTGTTPEQMEGWGWQSVHDPDVLPSVMQAWQAAIATGQPFDMEFPLRGSDGSFRTFLTRVQPLRNAQGEVAQWFGTNTDVDEMKRMESSLRDTQARLNSTLAAGAIGTWTWDIRNDRLAADEFTAQIFLIDKKAAAQGLPAAAYVRAVLEADQASVMENLQRAIETCGDYDIEYRVPRAAGEPRWIHARGRVEGDAAGQALYFHGAVMDVTERKRTDLALRESEEYFRFLNDLGEATRTLADPEQIMAVTAQMLGEQLHASRCAYADVETDGERFTILHDYTDGCASTVGDYRLSLFGPRAVETLRGGRTLIFRNVDAELPADEGAEMFRAIGIQAIITCPLVKQGVLRAMMAVHQTEPRDWRKSEIAIVQDVVERCWATIERRAAEEKIRHLNADLEQRVLERTAQLEAANKELESFSYSISHDLRSPLRAVDGFSRAVVEDFGPLLPPEGLRYLETIRQGAQRMGMLIDDLLSFSRLSRQPLQRRKLETRQLVQETIEDLVLARDRREITVRIGELPPCWGDPALLKQVWINLLANAFKYTLKQPAPVVAIDSHVAEGERIFSVRDNGAGFDMRYVTKLFGVFQRLHRAEDYEGTGVGLAIVQRIIHRHGGRVWAEGEEGRGATFYFTLEEESTAHE